MTLKIPFQRLQEAAHAVKERARQLGYREYLRVLGFKLDDPDHTWWLSPGLDNPGYRYGKLIFTSRGPVQSPDFFIGLNVEKGISGEAARVHQDRSEIMVDTWTWHRFLDALEAGEVDPLVQQAEATAQRSPLIAVKAGPPRLRLEHGPACDLLRFSYTHGALCLLESQVAAGFLQNFGTPPMLADLAARIRQLPSLDWIWIDFYAGFQGSLRHIADAEAEVWDADLIWRKGCMPWLEWLH